MRVFAVSDIHIDYQENRNCVSQLSNVDYVDDILILAGDVTDEQNLLRQCFAELSRKFRSVLFVPGNHDLWVYREKSLNSFDKLTRVGEIASEHGISMKPLHIESLSIIPLFSWYDFSFAKPCSKLQQSWTDFRACVWPDHMQSSDITEFFLEKNNDSLQIRNKTLISFSHFLPRIDLMPAYIPEAYHYLYPVLGTVALERQIRVLNPDIHVYGHSHVNCRQTLEGITYINNAFGYPSEERIASKRLLCIYEQ